MIIELYEPIFTAAMPILEQIESHGYEAYFVGGCVRDKLLELPIHDIDIASSALPDEIEGIFNHTFPVGKEHGTIIVVENKETYEITTFRTEGEYTDHRRPDQVSFVRNLEEDTLRRDFTINAMAIDRRGNLHDFHNGLSDLTNQIIRCVGEPQERFKEDALRMMRAIRFAAQLGFMIHPKTIIAITKLNQTLEYIAMERIRVEFNKFLLGEFFLGQSHLLYQTGLAEYLPGFTNETARVVMNNLVEALEPVTEPSKENDERLVWALMLIFLGITQRKEVNRYLRIWKHSKQFIHEVRDIIDLLYLLKKQTVNQWVVYAYDAELMHLVEEFYLKHGMIETPFIHKITAELPIRSKTEIVLNGKEVMDLLQLETGGPIIGQVMDQLEYLIVMGMINNVEEDLIEFVTHYKA